MQVVFAKPVDPFSPGDSAPIQVDDEGYIQKVPGYLVNDMYRSSSPIFDVPEFPALRRVKPLPKRRRTSISSSDPIPGSPSSGNDMIPPLIEHLEALKAKIALGASVEELRPHAESLSAYLPLGSGSEEQLLNRFAAEGGGSDDEQGDGDYVDHLRQPGNTKKRKVPANSVHSPRGQEGDSGLSPSSPEDGSDRLGPEGGNADDGVDGQPSTPSPAQLNSLARRKSKLSAATIAGLKHKELLKSRKRQLAAVLGALSLGDTLALDQALSATYPVLAPLYDDTKTSNAPPPPIRLSRRRGPRLARIARHAAKLRHPDSAPLPTCQFTYSCPSETAERLIATKEEVAMLRKRFEVELAKQAMKAAKTAAVERKKAASSKAKLARSKNADRSQRRPRTIMAPPTSQQTSSEKNVEPVSESVDDPLTLGTKTKKAKKKKRSALANASNPHHLRNYVPSRLPNTGANNANMQASQLNYLFPPPIRFLSAEIPPRRRSKDRSVVSSTPLPSNPVDEWICAFCEYKLFFGEEHEYRLAIKNRKKVLKRRMRARERAAAAASGKAKPKGADETTPVEDEYAEFDPSMPEEFSNSLNPRAPSWKGDPNKLAD
ncbi:hypothetical protein ONZ45_g18417 [Pleurotus djamor]|nr:hypothetical protein ONZ45_g18417 [Pleurotus djamor]